MTLLFDRWIQRSGVERWSRPPGPIVEKSVLLDRATEVGFSIPRYRIATHQMDVDCPVVSKAIGNNQSFDGFRRCATTRIVRPEMDYLFVGRQPCPTLLQDEVDAIVECRIGYSFGEVRAVSQRPVSADPIIDLRLRRVECEPFPVEPFVIDAFRAFSNRTQLQMFTADLLIDADDFLWLIDVNPDGLFGVSDDARSHLMNGVVAGLSRV